MEKPFESMTEQMFYSASSGTLTLEEAVSRLKQDARFRTVTETLARYCEKDKSDRDGIREAVTKLLIATDPTAKPDSCARKVRMWLKDDAHYISKLSAIQLAFGFELNSAQAERLLERLCGEGFHWRDPEDIVWLYALDNRLSFVEATRLKDRLMKKRGQVKPNDNTESLTSAVRVKVEQLKSEEELESFIEEAGNELGSYHNMAYSLFIAFLELLGAPVTNEYLPNESEMPTKEILASYMFDKYIPRSDNAKSGALSGALERNIKQNWPDEYTLSRMVHREIDVTRKTLILLFLATDGGESDYGDNSLETPENMFQDMYLRLNSMLTDCGFAPLDSRVPFDWMVLYCMCAPDSFMIDENMQRFLGEIFTKPEDAQDDDED